MEASILFEQRGKVALITLNRPQVFNSFNQEMALLMQKTLANCAANPDIRALVIKGNGKAFCAGQDLAEVTDPNGPALEDIVAKHYNPIVRSIREIEKPIIAGVNGIAAGAGANIALACDICMAAESAAFIQAFSKIGLIPDSGGTFFLPRLIGLQRATALMMTGEKVSAAEAAHMGMIYKAIADEHFETALLALAEKLADMPTRGLGLTKRALNASWHNDLNSQLAMEADVQTQAGESHDYQEGVQAFLEKRKPNFKGH